MDYSFLLSLLTHLGWEIECESCGNCTNFPQYLKKDSKADINNLENKNSDKISKGSKKVKKNKSFVSLPQSPLKSSIDPKTPVQEKSKSNMWKHVLSERKNNNKNNNDNLDFEFESAEIQWTTNMDYRLLSLSEEQDCNWPHISKIIKIPVESLKERYYFLKYELRRHYDTEMKCDAEDSTSTAIINSHSDDFSFRSPYKSNNNIIGINFEDKKCILDRD